MDMKPVSSSNIKAVGYDSENQVLAVQFHSGVTWNYEDVPQDVAESLQSAASVGKEFNASIKGQYKASQS